MEKKIENLTKYLEEYEIIIRDLEIKYNNEKNERSNLSKICNEYSTKISILDEIVKDVETVLYNEKLENKNLQDIITSLKLQNKKLNLELYKNEDKIFLLQNKVYDLENKLQNTTDDLQKVQCKYEQLEEENQLEMIQVEKEP